jgi:hypothetical protein
MNKQLLSTLLFATSAFAAGFAKEKEIEKPQEKPQEWGKETPKPTIPRPEGWAFDIGGIYTWMSFSTPPTYTGSTGGVLAKLTYQKPDTFFGQARSIYNIGPLSSSLNDASLQEWYSEFVAGYCVTAVKNWTITPYAGLGLDFLFDHHAGYGAILPIHLDYSIYYALIGLETHYVWQDWTLGLQIDCIPTFNQYLTIGSLSEAAWVLKNRTGVAVQLPVSYRYARNFWLEFAPYYRFLPVGSSDVLGLPSRNLNEVGLFLIFRFFI